MNCTTKVVVKNQGPVSHALVEVWDETGANRLAHGYTDEDGVCTLSNLPPGKHKVRCKHFLNADDKPVEIVDKDIAHDFVLDMEMQVAIYGESDNKLDPAAAPNEGRRCAIQVKSNVDHRIEVREWRLTPEVPYVRSSVVQNACELMVAANSDRIEAEALVCEKNGSDKPTCFWVRGGAKVWQRQAETIGGEFSIKGDVPIRGDVGIKGQPVRVRLDRTSSDRTKDQALWVAIGSRARAMAFDRYQDFMNRALSSAERRYEIPADIPNDVRGRAEADLKELGIHMHGVSAYQVLKHLTELFLLLECGVRIQHEGRGAPFDPELESRRLGREFSLKEMEKELEKYLGPASQLPYITRVVKDSFPGLLREGIEGRMIGAQRINEPCLIELIWSYWMEEGMLVQTMNAVTRRFQNVRDGGDRDPLANLEIDPLRPLNNLLWGYIQDEFQRLTVRRRAFEYDHHYGLTLYGKVTQGMRTADTRSKFLEAFHNLLHQAWLFYKDDRQTTVIADGFPLLKSLTEVHLILAQGAHNQFGDLPWTARVEMMLIQYMLARPEIRSFLQGRIMVPYKEAWEPQVDAMKTMQGWTDVTVSHFRDLAVYGEQLLLSIRYGNWIAVNDEYAAINWARYFQPEVQGYLFAYRAATGIDLTSSDKVDSTIPGLLLQKRVTAQQRR